MKTGCSGTPFFYLVFAKNGQCTAAFAEIWKTPLPGAAFCVIVLLSEAYAFQLAGAKPVNLMNAAFSCCVEGFHVI
ncbi:hypothetical protein [Azonexus sp. IMCC34839]|uniref:hypothetical protein n=1 Tax=Azonexus sp. IMCC34839 TaxID=3133695 RepID=UPI00399B3089